MSDVFNNSQVAHVVEIIKDKFYFATSCYKKVIQDSYCVHYFNTDNTFVYVNFNNDFGPLNLGCLYRYCQMVNKKLAHPAYKKKQIVHYTSPNDEKRANAAFLIACYSIIHLQKAPEEIYDMLTSSNFPPLRSFICATVKSSSVTSGSTINLLDCLHAIFKAMFYGFINFKDFDIDEYEKYYRVKNGYLNWVVPQKFIAFMGPSTNNLEQYIDYFIKNNVTTVVRLNRINYPASSFESAGIGHYSLFIRDGSYPPLFVLRYFLNLSETSTGAIAVHCKAGLGRTGTLIAAYLMKHYKMTAKEAIAWLRICRPGSVTGYQQKWLETLENDLWTWGYLYRQKLFQDGDKIIRHRRGIYSIKFKTERKSSKPLRRINNRNY